MRRVPDRALLARLESLAGTEHARTLEILCHLNEVERRRLHLSLGYGSLFDFTTRHLRYSASAAGRRIQVARCLRRHPRLLGLFRRREVNLSTVALISGVIHGNEKELIDAIRGKTQREVERFVAGMRPAREVRDRIRPVGALPDRNGGGARRGTSGPRRNGARPVRTAAALPLFPPSSESAADSRHGSHAAASPPETPERRYRIQFAAGAAFLRKLDDARAVFSRRSPAGVRLEDLFEAALDAYLDRHCPTRRHRRREERRARARAAPSREPERTAARRPAAEGSGRASRPAVRDAAPERPAPDRQSAPGGTPVWAAPTRSRRIPSPVRDAVFARDGGRCRFVGPDGVACESRHGLQVDHVEPFARGGSGRLENLRLLCAHHNQLEAERVYGRSWMERQRIRGPT